MVLKKDFLRKKRKGGKLDAKWVGPYIIHSVLGKGFYSLQLVENPEITIKQVCRKHLKQYNSTPSKIPLKLKSVPLHSVKSSPPTVSSLSTSVSQVSFQPFSSVHSPVSLENCVTSSPRVEPGDSVHNLSGISLTLSVFTVHPKHQSSYLPNKISFFTETRWFSKVTLYTFCSRITSSRIVFISKVTHSIEVSTIRLC